MIYVNNEVMDGNTKWYLLIHSTIYADVSGPKEAKNILNGSYRNNCSSFDYQQGLCFN